MHLVHATCGIKFIWDGLVGDKPSRNFEEDDFWCLSRFLRKTVNIDGCMTVHGQSLGLHHFASGLWILVRSRMTSAQNIKSQANETYYIIFYNPNPHTWIHIMFHCFSISHILFQHYSHFMCLFMYFLLDLLVVQSKVPQLLKWPLSIVCLFWGPALTARFHAPCSTSCASGVWHLMMRAQMCWAAFSWRSCTKNCKEKQLDTSPHCSLTTPPSLCRRATLVPLHTSTSIKSASI